MRLKVAREATLSTSLSLVIYHFCKKSLHLVFETMNRNENISFFSSVGSVILESPVFPVLEGQCVTLRCRNKNTSSHLHSDFYKDGLLIGNSTTENMVIHNVSTSDEGWYKCSISDVGESPESWLAVTGNRYHWDVMANPKLSAGIITVLQQICSLILTALHKDSVAFTDHSTQIYLILKTVLTVVMVALLLMLLGFLHWGKIRVT